MLLSAVYMEKDHHKKGCFGDCVESFCLMCQQQLNVIYVKWMWRYIMLIIIHLPNFIFNKTKL